MPYDRRVANRRLKYNRKNSTLSTVNSCQQPSSNLDLIIHNRSFCGNATSLQKTGDNQLQQKKPKHPVSQSSLSPRIRTAPAYQLKLGSGVKDSVVKLVLSRAISSQSSQAPKHGGTAVTPPTPQTGSPWNSTRQFTLSTRTCAQRTASKAVPSFARRFVAAGRCR